MVEAIDYHPDKPKCGAKKGTKKAGDQGFCSKPAGYGTDHLGYGPCKHHMGSTPAVTAKYKGVAMESDAARALAQLDVQPIDNPLEALALLAGQAVAWKDAMAARVNELMEIRFVNDDTSEQLRSEVQLWERALDRCEKVLVSMARLNIDERLAQIDERSAEIVTKAVLATLKDLDVSDEVRREARKSVGRHLRAV